MASPQKENGYTPIANELLEAFIVYRFTEYQRLVILHIWCKTYGFNKPHDWIANSQFVEATGIRKGHISRTLSELKELSIVTSTGNKIRVNKDWESWKVTPRGNNSYLYRSQKLPPQELQKQKAKNNIFAKAKNMRLQDSRKFESDYEETRDMDGNVVETKFDKEKKEKAELIASVSRIIDEFNKQHIKRIGGELPRGDIRFMRKVVKEALRLYTEKELMAYMPDYFGNDYYENTNYAIWTMMSTKVLNQLKNGK